MILNVKSERHDNEIQISHWWEGTLSFFSQSSGGGFRFQSRTQHNAMKPIKRLKNRRIGIWIASAINDRWNGHTVRIIGARIEIFQLAETHSITRIFMSQRNFFPSRIFFAFEPFPGMIDTAFRRLATHSQPVRFSVFYQYIWKNQLPWRCQTTVNQSIINRIDVGNNAKNTGFDINSIAFFIIWNTQISYIVSDDGLTGQHSGAGLTASARKCTGKIGGAFFL